MTSTFKKTSGWNIITPDVSPTTPAGAINDNFKALANLFSSFGVDVMVPAGDYVVNVSRAGSDTDRGTALRTAYATAWGFGPTWDKRATVIIPPGRYDLATTPLLLDHSYVDLIGFNQNDTLITSQISTVSSGTVKQSVDNVVIKNLTIENTNSSGTPLYNNTAPAAYFPTTSFPYTRIESVTFKGGTKAWSMRVGNVDYAGTYTDCTAGKAGFGGVDMSSAPNTTAGIASGTFTRCAVVGRYGFAGGYVGGKATGTFVDCISTDDSAFGCGTYPGIGLVGYASGLFINCISKDYSFGSVGTAGPYDGDGIGLFVCCKCGDGCFGGSSGVASGRFIDCTCTTTTQAGSFGGGDQGGTASGLFVNCIGGDRAFAGGGGGTASGTFVNCVGGGTDPNNNFGLCFGVAGIASGTFVNCIGNGVSGQSGGHFGGYSGLANGIFFNCLGSTMTGITPGGTDCFGSGEGGVAGPSGGRPGIFHNCYGGTNSFGGFGGTASGIFHNCVSGDYSFGGELTASGIFLNCTGGADAFGGGATKILGNIASGIFMNCTGGDYSFGGYGEAGPGLGYQGIFQNCTGGAGSFGLTASGTFVGCAGGESSFGGGTGGVASGQFVDCMGYGNSFGYVFATGQFVRCQSAYDNNFGHTEANGQFVKCTTDAMSGSNFMGGTGKFVQCHGGTGDFTGGTQVHYHCTINGGPIA